ncbi:MAG TPA: hypothetical protein PKY13_16455, partial [Microthrixaceae bacterium]|nr:hypothetical protein [Microthrixaceae bacterium]
MTSSPGHSGPTPSPHRWWAAIGSAVLAGLVVGVLVAGLAPWSQDASADADRASIRTQVAGISIERSSVDDEVESTVVSTLPAPTTTAAPTITAAPVTAPPTTAAPTTAVPTTAPA